MLNKLSGSEIREKFKQDLELEDKNINKENNDNANNGDDLIILKPLNLEHIKELSPKAVFDGADDMRFSLLNPSIDEKKYLAGASFLSLQVKEKLPQQIINAINSNIHLTIHAHKESSLDLIFLMGENNSLFVEAFLDDYSFVRISTLSKSGNIFTRFYSNCSNNSRFEAVNFSTASLNSSSKSILHDDSSCLIVNSYFNKKSSSKSNDIVIHSGKNTESLITSKGYLLDSKSDFRGLIKIEPSAFNSQGFQESGVLLEGASNAISIPDLEILNNEVKCSHGSTISRIKDEDLFYFESRGISKDDARLMLLRGHLFSVLPDVPKIRELAQIILEGDGI